MPHSSSAKKRMRQGYSARERNREQRSLLRSLVKRVRTAEAGEPARAALRQAEQMLDRAARKRLIHPNKAARTKSRLSKIVAAGS